MPLTLTASMSINFAISSLLCTQLKTVGSFILFVTELARYFPAGEFSLGVLFFSFPSYTVKLSDLEDIRGA